MTFNQHSLTLHFGEEDEELWEVLKRLPFDQQESVIKKVLTRYLKDHLESLSEGSNELNRTCPSSEWKLDSLFISSEIVKEAPNPLRHLFEVIGEEEDEEIIQFLSGLEKPPSSIQKENDSHRRMTSPLGKHQVEVTKVTNLRESSGLNFILQQVIGEEEDDEVLQFFVNSRLGEYN